MAGIQFATAETGRGKKRKKKPHGKNIMSASATQGGHKETTAAKYNVRICYAGLLGGHNK